MNATGKVKLIKTGKLKAVDNVKGFLSVIEKDNKKGKVINGVLVLNKKSIEDAKKLDERIKKGEKTGRLAGLGIIIKSNICVEGIECNCASKTLEGWIAPYDATVILKIKKEDGIILGMANMDEFACGGSGETSAFGPTKNPVKLDLIPGGTSSGSAASVAAEFCDLALGSDTGGSIRNPASHCGVVGVKPSYGFVSRYGLVDMAMSFDQIGPLAKDVESASLLLDVIKGRDEKDPISYKKSQCIEKFLWSKKLIEIKYIDVAVQTYYPIIYTEVYSGTRKFDGRRFGKKIEDVAGPELLRRILGGSEITKAEYSGRYYKKALQVKEIIKEEFEKAFEKVDCIIVPTCPGLPWKIGQSMSVEEIYAYDALTIPANLAEICAITIPAGKINGIPVGLQVFCGKGQESKMFSIAKQIESLNKS